jgi:ClpP class serine protease
LLDLWSDANGRGVLADDEAAAALLFTGQPGAARELVDELFDSGNAARRLRCLLGLGVLADASVRPHLERLLQGPARPDATAAAWALGRLRPDELQDVAARAAQKGPAQWLLRAALLTAGVPTAEEWLQACELSAEERALAGKVRPGLADFARIAELLRLRAIPPP